MNDLNPVLNTPLSMSQSRLPRFKRVKDPPPMVLMPRDKEILHQVYVHGFMTREQVERVLFRPDRGQDHPTKTSKARKRLKLLYHNGYLERIPIPVGPGAWAWRPLYRLAKRGAELVASELGTTPSKLSYWGKGDDREHRSTKASLLFLNHALKINDVRIEFSQAAEACGYRIEKWVEETHLKSQEMKDYVSVIGETGGRLRVAVIPDAYFVLNLGDRRAHFFLELDQATMSNKRWKMRIGAYLTYVQSGKYQERYQTHSLRVLTVTTSAKRLTNLKKTTESAGGREVFWFSTLDQVLSNQALFSPIWQQAGDLSNTGGRALIS